MDIVHFFGISLTIPSLLSHVLVYWRTLPVRLTRSTLIHTSKMDFRVDEGLLGIHQIESDSTLAIHCITKGGGPWSIQATLYHIRHLITFDRDTISHIYRESNQVTDLLASKSWERRYYFEYSAQELP
ncbi:Uncharacterized protein Adt_02975 [Abeliophyllum distichum]|uniref:RNase H type-1 domain-containing protein n=1 Tax=Abeliophyllum distichum TaxID=126358 RepID=A0ABD1VXE9_9LAMI